MIVIDYVRTMARQSIPFRNVNELESNFQQFLLAEGRRNASFGQWLQKKTYTSNLIQVWLYFQIENQEVSRLSKIES